jgi:hypothetical protein
MAPWLVVWFVVGIVSTVAVLACLIGLMRHILVLARTVQLLQDEVQPIADDLSREGQRAGVHISAIGERRRRGSAYGVRG